jgi:hypothetical protein
MPDRQRLRAAAWTIRSVSIRSRDGAERIEQVYRRLLHDDAPMATPPRVGEPPALSSWEVIHARRHLRPGLD